MANVIDPVARAQKRTAVKTWKPTNRIAAIDWMRGLVMVLMIIDHASMAFDRQPPLAGFRDVSRMPRRWRFPLESSSPAG